jgi:hypothetical protein
VSTLYTQPIPADPRCPSPWESSFDWLGEASLSSEPRVVFAQFYNTGPPSITNMESVLAPARDPSLDVKVRNEKSNIGIKVDVNKSPLTPKVDTNKPVNPRISIFGGEENPVPTPPSLPSTPSPSEETHPNTRTNGDVRSLRRVDSLHPVARSALERQEAVVNISTTGDVILDVSDESGQNKTAFRVSSEILARQSGYFRRMFGSTFKEGVVLAKAKERFQKSGQNPKDLPPSSLPRINVNGADLGTSVRAGGIDPFPAVLRILHGRWEPLLSFDSLISANLAVVGDHFDCMPALRECAARCQLHKGEPKKIKGSAPLKLSKIKTTKEERARQKVFAGWHWGMSDWLAESTQWLMVEGSVLWMYEDDDAATMRTVGTTGTNGTVETRGLWWDLPGGLEGEHYPLICVQ